MRLSFLCFVLAISVRTGFAATPTLTPVPLMNTAVPLGVGINSTNGVAADGLGNLYIADSVLCEVKKYVLATGAITILAGNGTCGSTGDGSAATSAKLNGPSDVRLDAAGNLYISDTFSSAVRVINMQAGPITVYGLTIPAGAIQTVASRAGCGPLQSALDGNGNLYIACSGTNNILRLTPAGSLSVFAGSAAGTSGSTGDGGSPTSALLHQPTGVAVDGSGNVYISDTSNSKIRVVNTQSSSITLFTVPIAAGTINTVASLFSVGHLVVDAAGDFYAGTSGGAAVISFGSVITGAVSTFAGTGVHSYSGDGGPATSATLGGFDNPALDPAGTLFIADADAVVRAVTTHGLLYPATVNTTGGFSNIAFSFPSNIILNTISIPASQGGAAEAVLGTPSGCTFDNATITPGGTVCQVVVTPTPAFPGRRNLTIVITDNAGTKYTMPISLLAFGQQAVMSPGTITSLTAPTLQAPQGMATDAAGNIYATDTVNNLVWKFPATGGAGVVFAGGGGSLGDGGPATSAQLSGPRGLAVDGTGNVYIGDAGNTRVRKVDLNGTITTFAGGGASGELAPQVATNELLSSPQGIAVDAADNVYFVDFTTCVVLKVQSRTNIASIVAGSASSCGFTGDGGAATSATLNQPTAVAIDSSGNLYIVDAANNRIRKVDTTGTIQTVAGGGGSLGDGGPATSAQLNTPAGIAVDAAGSLYISDRINCRVRKVDASGTITTIAGNGGCASGGDNGPATKAKINGPLGVALDLAGNLYIADVGNNVVRKVTATAAPQSFPNTNVGGASAAQTVTVSNIGNVNLAFTALTVGNQFTQTASGGTDCSASTSLAAGQNCLMALEFTPSASGLQTQAATVTDNSLNTNGSQQSVTLSGTANGVALTISAAFNPTTVDVNGFSTLTITLTNPNATAVANASFSNVVPAGTALISQTGGTCGTPANTGGGSNSINTGAGTLISTSTSLAAGASCNVTLNVKATAVGVKTDTTGGPTGTSVPTGLAASAALTIIQPSAPQIQLDFDATSIAQLSASTGNPAAGIVTLTFTITNPAVNTVSLTGIAFTDALPAGLQIAVPRVGACGGTLTGATVGSTSFSFSGGIVLAPGASCGFGVGVQGTTPGVYSNTTGVISATESGAGTTSNTVTITVLNPPSASIAFGAASVPVGGTTSLTFTLGNSNSAFSLSSVAVSDTLPAGLVVATPNGFTGSCGGGTITATAGSSSVSLSGATLAASSQCTFSVNVTSATAGAYINTTGVVSSSNGGTGNTATAGLNVLGPLALVKSFGATTIPVGGSTSLTFTITNSNTSALTGVGFTDAMPSGMTVVTPNGLTGSCGGGTITAAAGSGSVSLSGATLAASSSCTFSVNVTVSASGSYTNVTGAVSSTNGGTGNAATASLNASVIGPPTIVEAFGTSTLPLGGSTSLTFIILNSNSSALTGVGFTDTLPSGMTVATPNGLTGSCGGGTITALAGSGSASLSGASLAASSSCTFSVNVTVSAPGSYTNVIGAVSSTNGGTGNTASASLVVTAIAPPSISEAFSPSSVAPGAPANLTFNITNPNAGTPLTGVAFNDFMPAGLTIAIPNGLTGSCGGGTITANAGGAAIGLYGATLAAGASCSFSLNVIAPAIGTYVNNTGAVAASNSAAGSGATATLLVAQAAPVPSNGQVSPAAIHLVDYIAGNGTSVLSGAFSVSYSDGKGFTVSGSAPWFSAAVNGNTVNVSVNTAAVTSSFSAAVNLTFTFGDGTTQVGQVTMQAIAPAQFVTLSGTSSLTFTEAAGSGAQSQTITVEAAGSPVTGTVTATTSSGGNWLTVSGGGATPFPLTVTANAAGLAPGTYTGTITISSTAPGTNPLVIPVTLVVTPAGITVSTIDNAASMQVSPAAPNEVMTAFGTFPNCTAGAQVLVNGSSVTVLYSSPTQINFVVPGDIAGSTNATVVVSCAGLTAPPQTLTVEAQSPALFTVTQTGTGQSDTVNQDGSVDAAVPRGTVVQLYGTGFGTYAGVSPDGLTRLIQTVTATVGGAPAQVLFAGQAPGYTSGLQQIDVLIPSNLPAGAGVPLTLTIGGVTTQTGLTINIGTN
jgi:uncharacterized repeat protein (TIGR01451 family)